MPDREIVIKDIEEYLSSIDSSAPEKRLLLEVKELLKPVAPSVGPSSIDGNEDLLCGVCCVMVGYRNHGQVYRYCHYCPTCGKKVNWNDVGPAS